VGGASVAGVSVVDDSVVGASDAVEVESPPPQAEIAIVATRLEITKDRRNDMPVSLAQGAIDLEVEGNQTRQGNN
jgi:hypothetical protein